MAENDISNGVPAVHELVDIAATVGVLGGVHELADEPDEPAVVTELLCSVTPR